ncbi:cold-shock protein (plasmid) [Novosphingobium sp. BL-8A]|uniref:cold-shock protein n=1 Tax=Novosphingobium sp. BL-8A TaxID=3127639 RepID=UPI003756FFED
MQRGTVLFFSTAAGYGFIARDDGGKDCFVHVTAISASGLPGLLKGQRVDFDIQVARNGKQSAVNLRLSPPGE